MTIIELTALDIFALVVAANVHAALLGIVLWNAPKIWAREERGGRFVLALGVVMMVAPIIAAYRVMA